jgi:hypothetical protein
MHITHQTEHPIKACRRAFLLFPYRYYTQDYTEYINTCTSRSKKTMLPSPAAGLSFFSPEDGVLFIVVACAVAVEDGGNSAAVFPGKSGGGGALEEDE